MSPDNLLKGMIDYLTLSLQACDLPSFLHYVYNVRYSCVCQPIEFLT